MKKQGKRSSGRAWRVSRIAACFRRRSWTSRTRAPTTSRSTSGGLRPRPGPPITEAPGQSARSTPRTRARSRHRFSTTRQPLQARRRLSAFRRDTASGREPAHLPHRPAHPTSSPIRRRGSPFLLRYLADSDADADANADANSDATADADADPDANADPDSNANSNADPDANPNPTPTPTPTPTPPPNTGAVTSSNWSGYAVATNLSNPQANSVSAVSGSWIVPTVTGSSRGTTYSAVWVGIDGYSDSTVEQIGTEEDVVNGSARL